MTMMVCEYRASPCDRLDATTSNHASHMAGNLHRAARSMIHMHHIALGRHPSIDRGWGGGGARDRERDAVCHQPFYPATSRKSGSLLNKRTSKKIGSLLKKLEQPIKS